MEREEIKIEIENLYERWKTKCEQRDAEVYCSTKIQSCRGSDFALCFRNYLLKKL